MADNNKLSKPGLIPLKVENQGSLITTQVNKINFTGSGVTASVGQFNDLTILITGGGGSGVSSSYALTSSFAATASYFSGSISNAISSSYALTASYFSGSISNAVSSSYALTASYWSGSILNAISSSYALTASYVANASSFPYTGSAQITGSLGITGSLNTTGSIIATFITASSFTGSFTGSLFGSLLGTSSWAASASQAITSSFALNAISASYALSSSFAITSSYARTASYVNPLTQSLLVSGSTTITGSTNISGAFNLMGDINASSTTIILNSPSIALPGLASPYTPSPTVNTVMFDASNNVLFVTSSLPGGGGSGLADRIQTGSITASVAVGSNPLYPYFFLLQSSSRELLKFTTEGVMQLEAYYTTPTAITGGFMYSASGDFFVGL